MKKVIYLPLILCLLFSNCTRYFIAKDFQDVSENHKSIAVLPVEIIMTGKMPKDLNQAMIDSIEVEESQTHMLALYNHLLERTMNGKKAYRVSIQSYSQTLALLKENNIAIKDTWHMSPTALSSILGVDAVVVTRTQKNRYMGKWASYGIDKGVQVLDKVIVNTRLGDWLPNDISKTHTVKSTFTLANGADGATLYARSFSNSADWDYSTTAIFNQSAHVFGKHFPYKGKKKRSK